MNSEYPPGNILRVTFSFEDVNGNLDDPTTVTLKVNKPVSGLSTSVYGLGGQPYTIVRVSDGSYYVDLLLDESGQWWLSPIGTGDVVAQFRFGFMVSRWSQFS